MRETVPHASDAVPGMSPGEAHKTTLLLALFMLVIAAATIAAALAFQHIGGYHPCALCLMQRTPYYLGVPVAAGALFAVAWPAPRVVVVILFAGFAAAMLYGAGLAIYHSGVEWGFWEGPATCAPTIGVSGVEDMLSQLESEVAPSCTEAVWRFLGLSFAGWNALVSVLLAGLSLAGVRLALRAP